MVQIHQLIVAPTDSFTWGGDLQLDAKTSSVKSPFHSQLYSSHVFYLHRQLIKFSYSKHGARIAQ